MPVKEVAHGLPVRPNHVYVIPPNADMTIRENYWSWPGSARLLAGTCPSTVFFALAEDRKSAAVGVILSGTASDGTRGLEAIKAEGGITFAQDEIVGSPSRHADDAIAAAAWILWSRREKVSRGTRSVWHATPTWRPSHSGPKQSLSKKAGDGYHQICLLRKDVPA